MPTDDVEVAPAPKPVFRSYEPHPFLGMFPTGKADDIKAMKVSVQATGVQQKIRIWQDGRNKWWLIDGTVRQEGSRLAFEEALAHDPPLPVTAANGVPLQPEVEPFTGTLDEVCEFIKTTHVRKHYSQSQKAAIGVKLYYYEYKKTHRGNLPDPQAEVSGEGALSAVELANMYGVNEYFIRIARQLYRDAPDLLDAVALDSIPMKKANTMLKKRRSGDAPAPPGEDDEGDDKSSAEGDHFKDANGVDVPDNLVDAWRAKAVFKVLRAQVTESRGAAGKLVGMDGGGYIDDGVLDKQFSVVLAHMHNAEPHIVCPECDGLGHKRGQRWDCPRCKKLGYLCRASLAAERKAARAPKGKDDDAE